MTFQEQQFTVADGNTLFYRDSGSAKPPMLLLHSLSDNGRIFDAVVDAGLHANFRLIIPDGRGRGNSDRPEAGYSLHTHADDILQLMDHLGIERAILTGHSFGALLGLYLAAKHPERVAGLAMIDAGVELHPLTPLFLVALTDRLGRWYPSEEAYISSLRAAPFMTLWDERMRVHFMEDAQLLTDGSLIVRTRKLHIVQAAADIFLQEKKDWRERALAYKGPALVLTATEPFMMGQHINEPQKAIETAVLLAGGEHATVLGNHFTMMYGEGSVQIASALIRRFAATMISCVLAS